MPSSDKIIDHGTLRRLVEAGATIGAEVVGAVGGWGVVINYGSASQTLAVNRGEPRTFRKFETVASYLNAIDYIAEDSPIAALGQLDRIEGQWPSAVASTKKDKQK